MAKKAPRPQPKQIRPDDIDPHHRWDRPLQAPGRTQVDFEERVNFRRLHDYRLARVRAALAGSGLGALLSFDQHNIRYTTSTVIGEWARDKLTRYSLLTGTGDPYIWDFGSAAKHHRLYAPWLHVDHCKAGLLGLRGAVGSDITLFRDAAREIKAILDAEGVGDMPLGLDVVEPPMLFELQKLGIEVRDGQQVMLQAREVKNIDELTLLNMASAMVDGVYQDIAEALKPGVKESQIVALATARLYEMGSDCVEAINSISGERCSPHPHNFTDRLIRPGDQAFFDVIQSFMGYRTCYYRTFNVGRATAPQRTAYRKAREWMDKAIDLLKPGMSSDKIARAFPEAKEIGFASEMEAFGLNFCHGLGLGLHERPLISRLTSFKEPIELKAGMVFAVETYCPATDGISAARIEEEVTGGFAAAMDKDDYSFCPYRGHPHTLARGVPMLSVLGELMGRQCGLMKGKGGSMHLTSMERGVMGSYAIVGAHLPIAAGAAWSAQYRGTKQVAVAFFGDGATNIGAFHEALNLAAVWKLPVIFVCENNMYMEYTPIAIVTAVKHPAAGRAASYGLERQVIDGNDADVVYSAARDAIAKARSGGGPSLIECLTYRHSGHSRADPAKYRPKEELEEWLKRDPVTLYRTRLLIMGIPEAKLAQIEAEAMAKLDRATEAAKASPTPALESAMTDVWADGGNAWRN